MVETSASHDGGAVSNPVVGAASKSSMDAIDVNKLFINYCCKRRAQYELN